MSATRCLLDIDDGSPASELAKHISELSEDTYCATWEIDQEYDYWRFVQNPPTEPLRYGIGEILPEDIATLRKLSDLAGGWVYWHKADDPYQTGVRFVPMARWMEMVASRKAGTR